MSFFPLPSVAWYQDRASRAAGLLLIEVWRVSASMAFAPDSNASTSIPWSAAGTSPTGPSTEVRPPTQSHIGNLAIQFSFMATVSSLLLSPVIATAWAAKLRPFFS